MEATTAIREIKASAIDPERLSSKLEPASKIEAFTPGNIVQCLAAKCPCGNWVFVGLAGHLRRTNDVRAWKNLKCPTCKHAFSAKYETLELLSVRFLVFEMGYCTPDNVYKS
jgi:hypothetical protein